jgi:replicative DNA helicase
MDELPVTPEHFFDPDFHGLFCAIDTLHRSGKDIDQWTVQAQLGPAECQRLGYANLSDWLHYPSPAMATTLFETLCEKLTLRRAFKMGTWLTQTATTTKDAMGLCSEVDRRCAELPAVASVENLRDKTVEQVLAKIQRIRTGDRSRRMLTPIGAWNRLFGGISEGKYYALASRPGLGKTSMMEQMAGTYMAANMPVLIFERDMSPQVLMERIGCRIAGVPFWRMERECLNPLECDRVALIVEAIKDAPLILYSPSNMTAEMMCAITRRECRVNKIAAVFLDHIQCLRFVGNDFREGLTKSSLTIRNCVTDTNVPHIVLAHLNRDGASGRPKPENIKEFDQLFGDVDALALLWSEVEAVDVPEGEARPMKLYAAKNRGGPVSEDDLSFDGSILKFS